jgi:hypothetical protein
MKSAPKLPDADKLLHDLQHSQELQHQRVAGTELDPHLALLRTWQSGRLASTYADLLTDKQYRPACLFFLSDIYAPRDFSQRDQDIERFHAFLARLVPASILKLLTDVVELNTLTNELDHRLLRVLVDKLGMGNTITPELYASGYRMCNNYVQRVHQIDLVTEVVTHVAKGARLMVVGAAMKIMRGPAHRAGLVELYDFLEHGYDAFKQMRDVKTFVQLVERREKRILSQIFSSHPDPFAI